MRGAVWTDRHTGMRSDDLDRYVLNRGAHSNLFPVAPGGEARVTCDERDLPLQRQPTGDRGHGLFRDTQLNESVGECVAESFTARGFGQVRAQHYHVAVLLPGRHNTFPIPVAGGDALDTFFEGGGREEGFTHRRTSLDAVRAVLPNAVDNPRDDADGQRDAHP